MSVYALSPELSLFSDAADRRFRRILLLLTIPFLLVSLLIPLLRISGPEMGGGDLGERRYAELLTDAAPLAEVEEEPAPVEEPEPEPVPEPEPEPEPRVAEAPPRPEPEPEPEPSARERVREQFADDFAALQRMPSPVLTAQAPSRLRRSSDAGSVDDGRSDAVAASARAASGAQADGRTRQGGPATGIGDGQRRTATVDRPAGIGAPRDRTGSAGQQRIAGRSMDEIQLVFDRNKGSFYTLYNRALREDSSLRGKVTLRLTIAPDGSVTQASIVDSELRDPELERRILARVRSLNFGAKSGIGPFTVDAYPMYFLPS